MNRRDRLARIGTAPNDEQWTAIATRSPSPGAGWLLLVASTGIICKPGCAARIPGREQVRIVPDLETGLAAGARPCLRCHPDRPAGQALAPKTNSEAVSEAVSRLASAVEAGVEPPSDVDLAAALGVPERRLRDAFRTALGVTPREWTAARRAERLRVHLNGGGNGNGDGGILGAVFDAGYGSASNAYEAASATLGMAPGKYRSGGEGETIRWTLTAIPDGVALVAATERGLCAVRLANEPASPRASASLEAELRSEYPRATLKRDDSGLAGLAGIVADLAAGRPRPEASGLPLDVHATAFRKRVWEAMRAIPWGETRSYGQLAAAAGVPGAARAVGSACHDNPIPIVVPCHRVVGSDGSLHGYRYGLARKKQLLDAEKGSASRPAETRPLASRTAAARR